MKLQFLKDALSLTIRQHGASVRNRSARRRLHLDALEDRSVPAIIVGGDTQIGPLVHGGGGGGSGGHGAHGGGGGMGPMAMDDVAETDGVIPVTIAVLENDHTGLADLGATNGLDPDSVRIAAAPRHGQTTIDYVTGAITYTAMPGFIGTDSFLYTVRDDEGVLSNKAKVSVLMKGPTAADDWTDTDAGNSVAINVLANDSDPLGNTHLNHTGSVAIVTQPAHGTAVVDPGTNEITYTPAAGFAGTDSFLYTVTNDVGGTSAPAKVFVRVNRPTAGDDFAFYSATPIIINVLANDTDPEGNGHFAFPGSVVISTQPLHGTATVDQQTNEITYTPETGFNGTYSFLYTVTDDAGAMSLPAVVTVVGTQPTGLNDDATDTDGTKRVVINVLANDTPPNGTGQLSRHKVAIVDRPEFGRVSVNPTTGAIVYIAKPGFGGTDTFQYSVGLVGGGTAGTATVSVRVNRPTAADDWTETNAGSSVAINVLANDTHPDGNQHLTNARSVFIVSQPAHGKVKVNPTTNEITYIPRSGFGGTDSFRYRVTDDAGASSLPATVFIRVNRPTATDDLAMTPMSGAVVIPVLANDTDPHGNEHLIHPGSVKIVRRPAHGKVIVDPATNKVTYIPHNGFVDTDSFRYTVTDDAGATSQPATVTILVVDESTDHDDEHGGGPHFAPISQLSMPPSSDAAATTVDSAVVTANATEPVAKLANSQLLAHAAALATPSLHQMSNFLGPLAAQLPDLLGSTRIDRLGV